MDEFAEMLKAEELLEAQSMVTPIFNSHDLWELLFRFLFNFVVIGIIIHFFYYRKSRRVDYYFTFIIISVSIFFLIYLLGSVKRKIGFALGILAIVAVLTIGGILGYGYAADYYRENETLNAYNKTAAGSMTGRIMENYGPEAEANGPVSVPVSEVISGVDRVNDYVFRTAVGARVEVEVNSSQSFSIHAEGMKYGACRKLVMAP